MRDPLFSLGLHAAAIVETNRACSTAMPAISTACRIVTTIEHRIDVYFVTWIRRYLDHLTESAALASGPT